MRSGSPTRPFRLSSTLHALLCVVLCAAALALTPAPASAYDDGALSKAGPGAALASADLSKAKLKSADLSGANLSGANLSGAKLEKANLSNADLSNANLQKADLGKANLSGANLVGADLSTAKLGKANLSGARYDASTRWPRRFKVPRAAIDVGASAAPAPATTPAPATPAPASADASAYALTPADVNTTITAALPQINACLAGSDVKGELNMHWKILGSGATSDVTIASTQHAQSQGGACVKGVIAALSFPAHNKPLIPISNFPFNAP